MSHLTTLVHRYLRAHPSRKNHYVCNIMEYCYYMRKEIMTEEVEALVDVLENAKEDKRWT